MTALQDGNPREAQQLLNRHVRVGYSQFEWRLVQDLCTKNQPLMDFAFTGNPAAGDLSADGRRLAVCQTDGILRVIELENRRNITWPLEGRPRWWQNESYVSFAPDCHNVAYPADEPNATLVRNIETGVCTTLPGGSSPITSVAFSPDPRCRYLATGDRTGVITLWDWETHAVVRQQQHGCGIEALHWSTNAKRLASRGGMDVSVWDDKLNKLTTFRPPGPPIRYGSVDVAVSPNGDNVAAAYSDHTVRVWNVASGELIATFAGIGAPVNAVRFASDSMLISAGRDNVIRTWNLETQREHRALRGHSGYVWWLAGPSSDGHFASGGLDGHAMLWQTDDDRSRDAVAFRGDQVRDLVLVLTTVLLLRLSRPGIRSTVRAVGSY